MLPIWSLWPGLQCFGHLTTRQGVSSKTTIELLDIKGELYRAFVQTKLQSQDKQWTYSIRFILSVELS